MELITSLTNAKVKMALSLQQKNIATNTNYLY